MCIRDLPEALVDKMRSKAYAAPCSIMLIASPDTTSNVEVWEQVASASCTGYAIVLAATGLGYGAVWKRRRARHRTGAVALRGRSGRVAARVDQPRHPGAARPQEAQRSGRPARAAGGAHRLKGGDSGRHQPNRAMGGPMPASAAHTPHRSMPVSYTHLRAHETVLE